MATEQASGTDTDVQRFPKQTRWYQRPTVRSLKKQAQTREVSRKADERENDETRLPATEAVHLGGIVLTEAFTPSTVSSLYNSLERWPSDREWRKREWLEDLARSRGGNHGGWRNLGVVRPPGAFIMGDGYTDPDLPPGVDAVWLHLSYVTPTLAMVVATFTLAEGAGDLSDALRRDYGTENLDTDFRVYGRFGELRSRIPWSRPARHGVRFGVSPAEDQKRRASQTLIRKHEEACSGWFFARFRGRFAAAKPEDRPIIRMLFTENEVPFTSRSAWFRPIGLDFALPLWRSTDPVGWWLSQERWPYRDGGRQTVTLVARRTDAAEAPSKGETGVSNWFLTQRFGTDHASLASRHAMVALLAIYADRLGEVRDKAGVKRSPSRPVRDARALDDYLIRDGLDAATVTSDLESFTDDVSNFRWGVPEFTEHREHLTHDADGRTPLELVPTLCAQIRRQAARLASDTQLTAGNIRASAELRQAIANTRLQRILLLLALAATVLAVVSLVTARS